MFTIKNLNECLKVLENISKGMEKISQIQDEPIVENGKIISELKLDPDKLSENEEEAMKEAGYLDKVKAGNITEISESDAQKLTRDFIKTKFD